MIFAPLLAISGLAFPLNSDALYTALALTLVGLLAWVASVTTTIARRNPTETRSTRTIGAPTRAT